MALPLVSIITPSFNQGDFIGETIESVLAQDYPRIEYLIIDGGSTDQTLDVLKRYKERVLWISEPDEGQSDAINKGLARSTGDILTYINSDDLLAPNAASQAVAFLEQHPDVACVYGECAFIDSAGHPVGLQPGQPFSLENVLLGKEGIPQAGAFWRRRVTETIGGFDENLHYTMDVDYWLRMALAGFELAYLPGVRASYRLHEHSKTVSQTLGFWDDWDRMMDKLFLRPDLPPQVARLERAARNPYFRLYRLQQDWETGSRQELRPILRKLIAGGAPPQHRALALLMLLDSYVNTDLSGWVRSRYLDLKT